MKKILSDRIYTFFAQVPGKPEQPQSAFSGNQGLYLQDDSVCAFLPERHKNSGNPVSPVKKGFEFQKAKTDTK
ncbi:MAG: hypothetical protein WA974_00335 [Thermodesulfobacteriota bacterium]